jgi:1,4-alpha-glucan branching enzyme
MTMRFVLTLHSHLPWVLHHGRWPHGSDWICEAALDSYLPLIAMLEELDREDVAPAMTLGITPILAAQFAHQSFREELDAYFAHRLKTLDEAPESLRQTGDAHLIPVAAFWKSHVLMLQATWERIGKDLIAAFRRQALTGRIELISSAATHGFLPLLSRDESIRFQLLVGRAEHARHFGDLPRGCWVPECAYRPAGPWQPIPAATRRPIRAGIEDHLRYAGFQWFFVDAHVVEAGETYDLYSGKAQPRPRRSAKRSPYQAYRVGNVTRGRPIHVLVRDPKTTAQVWSRHGGYPGDGAYLEFHKIRYPGGLKLWKVTDATADLGAKQPYDATEALATASRHAEHFASLLETITKNAKTKDHAIIAPFDTELFGHWWFEGMDFLKALYEGVAPKGTASMAPDCIPSSAGEALAAFPPKTPLRMSTGSWGKDGDFSMWLNPETEWTWLRLWALEERFWNAAPTAMPRRHVRPVLEQAARELLLAQSSDWQFIISTGAAGDYATKRFVEHCEALESLLPYLENPTSDLAAGAVIAGALQVIDGPFPDLIGAIAAASDVTAP